MNHRMQDAMKVGNPFKFKHISRIKGMSHFDEIGDIGPSVVMASPGMMQSGFSRELFERWAPSRKNGVIIAGYCVEGTLAKDVMKEPEEVMTMSGHKLPRKLSVDYISFSAHVDYVQNRDFVLAVKPSHVVCPPQAAAFACPPGRGRAALGSIFRLSELASPSGTTAGARARARARDGALQGSLASRGGGTRP